MLSDRHPYFREAVELFEIARRLLEENNAMRIEIEPRLWFQRQRLERIVIFWRPEGFSQIVLVGTSTGPDKPRIDSFQPGGWRKVLRRAARAYDADKVAIDLE